MTLHIFNPDHDLVLAAGNDHFTPPKAARDLYADLGFLPALWAKTGDLVLVADTEATPVRDKGLLRRAPIAYSFQCVLAVPRAYSRRNSMLTVPHRDS